MNPPPPNLIGVSEDKVQKHRKLLYYCGVKTDDIGSEFLGDCPFCGKAQHFSMNKQTAEWRCLVGCKTPIGPSQGNAYNFIRAIHAFYLEATTPAQRLDLIAQRKGAIDLVEVEDFRLCFNYVTNEWVLPIYNDTGQIVNLNVWRQQVDTETNKTYRQLMSMPALNQVPCGLHRLTYDPNKYFWVLEGYWDYLAFIGLIRRLKQFGAHEAIGTLGTSIPRKYLSLFGNRKVNTCFDNDDAGRNAHDTLLRNLVRDAITPISVHSIKWTEGLPKGFDVSDVVTSLPQALWKKKAVNVNPTKGTEA